MRKSLFQNCGIIHLDLNLLVDARKDDNLKGWRKLSELETYVAKSCKNMMVCHMILESIMKTCQCKVYPLKPYFYIVKLGYAGVYLFFLFLLQNIDCGYSLEQPRRGGSNVYPQSMF